MSIAGIDYGGGGGGGGDNDGRTWVEKRETHIQHKCFKHTYRIFIYTHYYVYTYMHTYIYIYIIVGIAAVQTIQLIVMSGGFVYAHGQFDSLWPEQVVVVVVVGSLSCIFFSLFIYLFFYCPQSEHVLPLRYCYHIHTHKDTRYRDIHVFKRINPRVRVNKLSQVQYIMWYCYGAYDWWEELFFVTYVKRITLRDRYRN